MGKGSNTTSTTSTSSADPQAAQLYRDILQRAQGVASTPYQAYTGDLTAPINSQQQTGIAGINANANYASPFIQQAASQAGASSAPITGQTIQGYQNPYTQQVIDATTGQLTHDNATQMASLQGNQIAQGALGGNATGVAKGILAGQQGRTMASTTAQLYDQSYKQALQAAQQQQQTGLAGANALANYGISGQNAALTGATAQLGAGSLQQQNEQQRLNALYQQYAQAQAYPYQQTQWLAGVGSGIGSNLGGVSSGTTTGPAPNQTAQWVGAGLTAASLLSDERAKEGIERIGQMNDGTPIYRYRYKGSPQWHVGPMAQEVEERNPDAVSRGVDGMRYVDMHEATEDSVHRAAGGGVGVMPWADVGGAGWIPQMNIHGGSGAPRGGAPSAQNPAAASFDPTKMAAGIKGVQGLGLDWGGMMKGVAGGNGISGEAWGGGSFGGGDAYGGSSASPLGGLSAEDYGAGFAAGGGVGGGVPLENWLGGEPREGDDYWPKMGVPGANLPFEERAAPVQEAISSGNFDPAGANSTTFEGTPGMVASNNGVVPTPRARPEVAGAPVVAEDDDEEVAPVGVAGRSSAAPSGGVAAFAPEGPGSYGAMPDAIRRPSDERAGLGLLPLSKNAGTGLLTAGLGMLASRSPFLGNAIGEGGIAGVSAYGAAEENDRKIAAEAEKLRTEARKRTEDFGLSTRKQTEVERHNKASEKESTAGRAPMGMRFNKNGELEDIPGWVSTLEKAAKARKGPDGEPLSDDAIRMLAGRVRAGDVKALVGFGRGAQGAADLRRIHEQVAKDAAEGKSVDPAAQNILQNAAQQAGLLAAERTQAQIMAKLSVYGRTAFKATGIAERLSDEVPRTSFMPVNKILNAAREKTGDPKIVALGQALMTLTNEYARAIGGGHGTVHDKEAAEKRLSAAQTHEQLKAVIAVMRQEILAEESAMPEARQHIRDIYNPKPGGGVHSIAGENGLPPPSGPVPGASGFKPPADAIPRHYNGRTYYYDPVTKQPYPGQ